MACTLEGRAFLTTLSSSTASSTVLRWLRVGAASSVGCRSSVVCLYVFATLKVRALVFLARTVVSFLSEGLVCGPHQPLPGPFFLTVVSLTVFVCGPHQPL